MPARIPLFSRVELCLIAQLKRSASGAVNSMNHRELRAHLCRRAARQAKHSFRICTQANGTEPFPVLQGPRHSHLSVLDRHHRTAGIVEHLGCGGPKEHLPESAGVRRHDNKIEFACPCDLGNLDRRFTRAQHSRTCCRREFRFEKQSELAPGDGPMLFRNLVKGPQIEFESVVAF